jgi:hypothetical protein
MDAQLPLIANLDTTEDAYRQAIRDCRLPAAAERVAVWMLEAGRREMVGSCRCQAVPTRPKTKLAAATKLTASSAYRGLRRLLELGLVVPRGSDWLLVLSRFCELREARTTCDEDAGGALGSGWSANEAAEKLADRGPPGSPRFTPVQAGSARFSPVQPSLRSEKENINKPESLTDTEPIGVAAGRVNHGEPGRTGPNRGEPAAKALPAPGDLGAAKRALNRTDAWQDLKAEDFAEGPPRVEKLRACYRAAVRAGVLRDCRDAKLQFLATAYDCAASAGTRNPAGALVYRTAAGTLHWATVPGAAYEWAKAIVDGPPARRTETDSARHPERIGTLAVALATRSDSHPLPASEICHDSAEWPADLRVQQYPAMDA